MGAPRSGTSILYRTILKHPSFAVAGDEALQLAESGLLDQLHSAPRWKAPRPPRLWLYFLKDEVAYGAFLADVHAATKGAQPVDSATRPPWTKTVIELFLEHATTARSCRRLVEKTPTHIDRAEWLLDSLRDAKLVFIHRHPLEVFTSYRRRALVDRRAQGWADLTVEEFSELYRRQSDHARRLASTHADRFITVGYEVFTSDPESEAKRLCAFLGEEYTPAMIEERSPDLSRSTNDPHLWGQITPRTKTWSDFVDPATAELVEDETEAAARAWGYGRMAPAGTRSE
ncbi:hypothetical protein BH23ACT5_BH23ACT5_00930 [soil metagenome]